jgi:hypothetical protein
LAEGEPNLDSPAWQFTFWRMDATALCTVNAHLRSVNPVAPPASAPVWGWWAIAWERIPEDEPAGDTGAGCAFDPPATTTLGVGANDDRLKPAMEQAGLEPELSAYGVYWEATATQVFVFGVATAPDGAGIPEPVTQGPLPDGTYEIRTLHLLPFSP